MLESKNACKGKAFGNVSVGADTKAHTLAWGRGVLEVDDHRLLEDSSERGGALVSDAIAPETARDGWEQARVNGR